MTQIIVKQQTGIDSTVTVTEEAIGDRKTLTFVTDQQLFTGSNRAWEVEHAIMQYAQEQGYRVDKHLETATYDPDLHSYIEMDKVREQVKADPHFELKARLAEAQVQTINNEYARATRLLKNLLTALQNRQRMELKLIGAGLSVAQHEVMDTMFVSPIVNEQDRSWLDKPFIQVEIDHFASGGVQPGELPDRETLLDLLTLVED